MEEFFTNPIVIECITSLIFWIMYFFIGKLKNNTITKYLKALAQKITGSDNLDDLLKVPSKQLQITDESKNLDENQSSVKEENIMKSTVSETPVTVVKRELNLTLDENEVKALKDVIESSGKSSNVSELYAAVSNFQVVKK